MSSNGKEETAPTSIPPENVALLESSNNVTPEKPTWKSKKSHSESGESSDEVIEGNSDSVQTEVFEEGLDAALGFMNAKWDPDELNDGDQVITPSHTCIRRIKNDIMAIYADPPPGLCVVPDPNNITKIHALITGPFDTPYEGGFFYFLIRFPPDYPINPPRVRLMTTGGGTVRFNPNLYKNGKVCLSILGFVPSIEMTCAMVVLLCW